MKQEYKDKLELAKKLLHDSQHIEPNETARKIFWEGHSLMEELVKIPDTEVLCGLFDLFTEENENGVCETLEGEIFDSFTMEQIIEALHKKFPQLITNNRMRAEAFMEACLNTGNFNNFKNIFNNTKASKSRQLLDEFEANYGEGHQEEISILRKDMEAWPKK